MVRQHLQSCRAACQVLGMVFLMVGVFEELFSRGYLQATLARGIGFWLAAILMSTLFGALHIPNGSIIGLVALELLVSCSASASGGRALSGGRSDSTPVGTGRNRIAKARQTAARSSRAACWPRIPWAGRG